MVKSSTAREIVFSSVTAGFVIMMPSTYAQDISPYRFSHSSVYNANHILRYGNGGQPVKYLQLQLKSLHFYDKEIDGKYGIHTQNAVKDFQRIHRLTLDGIADTRTINRIAEVKQQHFSNLKIGDSGEEVKQLQVKLQTLDYYHGNIDGIFGVLTKEAVTNYQQQNNLKIDGIAGQHTRSSLEYNKNKQGKTITSVKVKNIANFSVNTSIIAIAKNYNGVPYQWGGTTPSGFDCSGFLQFIYEKKGITIPRTVSDIWNFGTNVPKLSVGDIVFFETYKKGPSHAGLYLGNGDFIHTDSDLGVTISNLSASYWKSRYIGAKRIVQF